MGHPSPKVIKNLPKGVKVIDPSSALSTTEYKPYTLAKAVNVISRRLATPPKHPFKRVSVDWFQFEKAYNGMTGSIIIKCDLTAFTKVIPAEGKDHIGSTIKRFKA